MIITCENCGTRFNLDESLLDANGSTVRCSRCRHMFTAFPLPPEPEFDPLELDDSDADQTLEFDDSDFDEADDLTEDDSPESFDSEELELEAIDPDEIEIEIETADTVTAEEEEAETKSAEEPDLSKELDSGIKPGIMQKNEQFQEELGLDEIFSEDKEPDFDLAFDLDEKELETEKLDWESPEDREADIGDSKTSSLMEDSGFLQKTALKDDIGTDKPEDFDHDEQGFDGLEEFDDPDFDETDTSDTSSHPPLRPRRSARASLIQPADPEAEWMEEKADTPPQKILDRTAGTIDADSVFIGIRQLSRRHLSGIQNSVSAGHPDSVHSAIPA